MASIWNIDNTSMCSRLPTGLISSSTTATTGATRARPIGGKWASSVSPVSTSAAVGAAPCLRNTVASNTATARPHNAGTTLPIITWEGCTPNPEAAAMVFGLGDMMLPALPPPDKATNSASLEMPNRLPTSMAIGATISTATGMNTPTAQIIIVANASEKIARLSPNLETMVLAMRLAAPDSIITPARMPAASTRTMVPITLWPPATTTLTVWVSDAPPTRHPTMAPSNSAYVALSFLRISTMANARPSNAAHHAIEMPSTIRISFDCLTVSAQRQGDGLTTSLHWNVV